MADERLVSYLQEGLRRGYTIPQLRQSLLKEGWNPQQIGEALNELRGDQNMAPVSRPTGVTVICILGCLNSAVSVIALIGLFALSAFIGNGDFGPPNTFVPLEALGPLFLIGPLSSFFVPILVLSLIISCISFLAFYLLLKMKRKGLLITMLLVIISIVMQALFLNIIGIAFSVIILAYLWRKRTLFVS